MQLAGRQWAVSAVAVICFCGCLFQLSTCPLCACEPSGGAGKLMSTRMWAELEGRKWGGVEGWAPRLSLGGKHFSSFFKILT